MDDDDYLANMPIPKRVWDWFMKVVHIKQRQTTYKCDNCQHQYSPHLSKKCPKCGWQYLEKHINVDVQVQSSVEKFNINIDPKGIKEIVMVPAEDVVEIGDGEIARFKDTTVVID